MSAERSLALPAQKPRPRRRSKRLRKRRKRTVTVDDSASDQVEAVDDSASDQLEEIDKIGDQVIEKNAKEEESDEALEVDAPLPEEPLPVPRDTTGWTSPNNAYVPSTDSSDESDSCPETPQREGGASAATRLARSTVSYLPRPLFRSSTPFMVGPQESIFPPPPASGTPVYLRRRPPPDHRPTYDEVSVYLACHSPF